MRKDACHIVKNYVHRKKEDSKIIMNGILREVVLLKGIILQVLGGVQIRESLLKKK
jgi:type IV secretory pathway TrbD component